MASLRYTETVRNTMSYTLKQAADATGKSKPTIWRAIQRGRIAAQKDQNGEWQIDPFELHRVFEPGTKADTRNVTAQEHQPPCEIAMLRQQLALREEQLAHERQERERERETIAELRRQLAVANCKHNLLKPQTEAVFKPD